MPLFEYRCAQCQHLEEVLQKHGEPAPAECPACGAQNALEKEVSLTSFQLKGGGWYKDLYSSSPNTASSGASDSSPSSSSSSTSKPSEAGSSEKTSAKSDSSGTTEKATTSSEKKSSGKVA